MWMRVIARGWLVLRLTDSAFALGYVAVLGVLPALPVSLVGGALIDRFPKRQLIMATQAGLALQALVLATLTWSGVVQVWHLILLEMVWAVLGALDQPARQSFVVEMVGPEDLTNAIALNSSLFNATRAIGPAIGGLVLATVGEAGCFLADGLGYVGAMTALLLMRGSYPRPEPDRRGIGRSTIDGYRYVLGHPALLGLLALAGTVGLLGTPFLNLMPVFARDVLEVGEKGLGFLTGAVGVGAVLGSLWVATLPSVGRSRRLAVLCGLLCLFLVVFAFTPVAALAVPVLAVAGAAFVAVQALDNSLVQTVVDGRMRGRVMSIYSLLFVGSQQLGTLLAGAAADLWGGPLAVAGTAVLCALVVAGLYGALPTMRRVD
jgi:predicted MFS family arabinose efflux permease